MCSTQTTRDCGSERALLLRLPDAVVCSSQSVVVCLLQVPTVRNINLKYGSLGAFFKHLDADIICMQVGCAAVGLGF